MIFCPLKNQKGPSDREKLQKFLLHWLLGHVQIYAQDRFIKYCPLTSRDLRELVKIFLKLLFLTKKRVFRKTKEDYKKKKNSENVL